MLWRFPRLLRQRCSHARWPLRPLRHSLNTAVEAVADPTVAVLVAEHAAALAAAEVPARQCRPAAAALMPPAAILEGVPAAATLQIAAAAPAIAAAIPGTRSTATAALRNQRLRTAQIPCLREISNPKGSATNAPAHFAAGNNTWVEPPKTAASTTGKVNYYGPANVNASRPYVPFSTTTRGAVTTAHGAAVVSAQHPYRPIGPGYNYYPYYPYPYFGYNPFYAGFGFGWGGYGPCSPFWGCAGYGNGFGYGFGYGYGYGGGFGSIGSAYPGSYDSGWTDESAEGSESKTSPDDPSSYIISANPSAKTADTTASNELSDLPPVNADQQPTYVLLFLKDGSNFAVSDYWLSGGKLHYVTSYGGENAIDEAQLDLQRTVDENATRGVTFSLRPQQAPAPEPERLQK